MVASCRPPRLFGVAHPILRIQATNWTEMPAGLLRGPGIPLTWPPDPISRPGILKLSLNPAQVPGIPG